MIIQEASIVGLFRTVLIVLGVIVLLRFMGRLFIAKRNLEEDRRLRKEQDDFEKEMSLKRKNVGKTSFLSGNKSTPKEGFSTSHIEDADFEEIK